MAQECRESGAVAILRSAVAIGSASLKIIGGGASVLALCFATPIIVVGPLFTIPIFFDAARDLSCRGAGR